MTNDKRDVVKNLDTVHCLGQIFYSEHFITDLTVGSEINVWIFTTGRLDVIQFNFFQSTFPGSGLFGFGSVSRETGNKFLQFLDLLFLFLVCFLHLTNQKLTGLIPEIVVAGIELDLAIVNISGMSTYFI